jgi:phage gp29-like protein
MTKRRAVIRREMTRPANSSIIMSKPDAKAEKEFADESIVSSIAGLLKVASAFDEVISVNGLDGYRVRSQHARGRKSKETVDPPIQALMTWNSEQIQGALQQHHLGQFALSGYLIEAMLSDAKVGHALNSRIRGVTKRAAVFKPSKVAKDQKQARYVADQITELSPDVMPMELIEQLLQWTVMDGFGLFNQTWDTRISNVWVPRIKHWHPIYTYFLNSGSVDERKFQAITTEGVVPIAQNEDPEWLLFTPWGHYRGWIRAAVRQVAIPWIVRTYCMRDWSRCSEVHGMPQRVAKVPANALEEDKARLFGKLIHLASEACFILPQAADGTGFDLSLLEPKNTKSWEVFQTLAQRCDSEIDLAIKGTQLMGNMGSKGTSSSMAASKEVRKEDSDYADSDCIKLGSCLRNQLWKPFCQFNHCDPDLAPICTYEELPDSDPANRAKVWVDVGAACASFKQSGFNVDPTEVKEEFGITLEAAPEPEESEPIEPSLQFRKTLDLQRIEFDSEWFDRDEAIKWLVDNGYEADISYGGMQHELCAVQSDASRFVPDSFQPAKLETGRDWNRRKTKAIGSRKAPLQPHAPR